MSPKPYWVEKQVYKKKENLLFWHLRERALGILDVVLYLSLSAGIQASEPLIQAAVSHSENNSAPFDSKDL